MYTDNRRVYCATACNATHGIAKAFLSVSLSVCLSVCQMRARFDQKETCEHILIQHKMAFILVL